MNMEGINKVLAQWIWTVSWKGWELLIFVAHWFKKGQEIATRLQLWGGLSKALCWCKEELKSLRYYTSKREAWGFRKKKQAKVFASIYKQSDACLTSSGLAKVALLLSASRGHCNTQLLPLKRTHVCRCTHRREKIIKIQAVCWKASLNVIFLSCAGWFLFP